jgi:hypothetical protein
VENRVCLWRAQEISACIVLEKFKMNAKELADKFNAKTDAAVVERERQSGLAGEHIQKRSEDIEHCKRAMESNVLPFLAELKQHLGEGQFPLRRRSTYRITSRSASPSSSVMEEQRAYQRRSETS